MKYLSDGESDGFALFYIKDEKLKTVCLNKDQADRLDVLMFVFASEGDINVKTPDDLKRYL